MGLVYMVHSDPRQSFGIISLLFFGYTISLSGRVSGEQRGGAAENSVLDRSGSYKLTSSTHGRVGLGPIFTY